MKRKLSALILGAAALAVGFGSLAVAGVVAHKDAIVQTKAATATASLVFNSKCGGKGTDDQGGSWTISSDSAESTFDKDKGIHYGTSNATVSYIHAVCSNYSDKTITKIVVNASANSTGSPTVSVSVGGSAFGGAAQSLSSTNAAYTFSGSASGEIIVSVSKKSTKKALYLKSIEVTYDDGNAKSISVSSSAVQLDEGANSDSITITSKNFTADSYGAVSSNEAVATAVVSGSSIVINGVAQGTATITVNAYLGGEVVASADISVKVTKILTVAEARQASEGEVVTYSGTIIAKETSGSITNYYIQQGTKGIEAYAVSDAGFNIGDGVKVTGTLTIYNGLYETKNNTMVSYEEAKEDISPAELSVTYNDDDCTLVSATGLTFDSGDWTSGNSANINFLTSSNESIQIHISKAISASLYTKLDWGNRTGDEIYSLTGVKGIFNGTVQCFIVEGCVLSTDADEAAVDTFVATYITTPGAEDYTTIAEADRQASCVDKYTAAKAALEALTENQQSLFNYNAKYADAREIYNIWKAAYDAQNGGSGAGMLTFDTKESTNSVLISTLGAAAVLAAAGFIFLKKKKA